MAFLATSRTAPGAPVPRSLAGHGSSFRGLSRPGRLYPSVPLWWFHPLFARRRGQNPGTFSEVLSSSRFRSRSRAPADLEGVFCATTTGGDSRPLPRFRVRHCGPKASGDCRSHPGCDHCGSGRWSFGAEAHGNGGCGDSSSLYRKLPRLSQT